jgi:hypothetical protein
LFKKICGNRKKQQREKNTKHKTQKGDISNLVRKGTFLFWFDTNTPDP